MINKILIANRGEIAVRIIRACKELELTACTIYSEADYGSVHVRLADEAFLAGPSAPEHSYLNISKIIKIALENNIDAIHPGYGFLAENADFISEVEKAGIIFIGPGSEVVRLMGNKIEARKFIKSIGVPYVPGSIEPTNNPEEVIEIARETGYPVILKAAAGGGGKGMRIVESEKEIASALERAQSEALKSFNDDKIYVEKYIRNPKHIEVQLLSDQHGNHRHLFERECSIQRRYQKIIEEAPSGSIDERLRSEITSAALKVAKESNYTNAGTIEFLLDNDGKFYFLEMNTRLQVEHPVTEAITGIDIVKEQISIASGNRISFSQNDIEIDGYSIECRINSEDPFSDFTPSIGRIGYYNIPSGKGIRVDSGVNTNSEVTLNYDSLLAKLIIKAESRESAIKHMKLALQEFQISGVITNLPVHLWVFKNNDFINSTYNINTLENQFSSKDLFGESNDSNEAAAALGVYIRNNKKQLKPAALFTDNKNNWTSDE